MLAGGEAVYAFPSSGYWIDIGNPEKYSQLNFDLLSGKGGQYGFKCGDEIIIGHGSRIHPTARLKGPLLVGDNCHIGKEVIITGPSVIGPECRIEDAATVSASVIWQRMTVGSGCRLISSIAASGCNMQPGSEANRAVLGDNVTISRGYKLEPGTRVEPGKTMGSTRRPRWTARPRWKRRSRPTKSSRPPPSRYTTRNSGQLSAINLRGATAWSSLLVFIFLSLDGRG